MSRNVTKNRHDLFWYAIFIYATMIVDIYRKVNLLITPLPFATTMVRNVVYICLFLIVAWKLYRDKVKIEQVVVWGLGFVFCLMGSYLINIDKLGISLLMTNVLYMFVSRLLPAMFIAKAIVGREKEFLCQVCRMRIIALVYIIIIFLRPETSENSYITISGNLVLPVLIFFFTEGRGLFKIFNWCVGIAGLIVIIIYGGRGSLVACLAAVAIYFFYATFGKAGSAIKKIVIGLGGVLLVSLVFFQYERIIELLLQINPTSRTLKLLSRGDFLWTSGRNHYYDAALESFEKSPFKVYGFLGDRYFFADQFGDTHTVDVIETMYAHNVFYEWMLNFGIFIGVVIIAVFVYRVIRTATQLLKDPSGSKFFAAFFGVTIISMLTSSSYLNDYMIWFVWGWMAEYVHAAKKRKIMLCKSK